MFSSARALAAAGAAAIALAAAAPAAQAEVRHVYDAWFGAGVGYATEEASESGKVTRRTSARLVATGWLHGLRFIDGMLITQRTASGTKLSDAEAELHYVNDDISPPDVTDCVDRAPRLGFAGLLNPLRAFDPRAAPAAMGFSPFSMVSFDLNCDVGGTLLGLGAVSHRPGDLGPGHLRVELVVPRGKLGDEQISLRAQRNHTARATCPGEFVESDLRACRTALTVNMILYRTYEDPDVEDDLLAPLVPQRPMSTEAPEEAERTSSARAAAGTASASSRTPETAEARSGGRCRCARPRPGGRRAHGPPPLRSRPDRAGCRPDGRRARSR